VPANSGQARPRRASRSALSTTVGQGVPAATAAATSTTSTRRSTLAATALNARTARPGSGPRNWSRSREKMTGSGTRTSGSISSRRAVSSGMGSTRRSTGSSNQRATASMRGSSRSMRCQASLAGSRNATTWSSTATARNVCGSSSVPPNLTSRARASASSGESVSSTAPYLSLVVLSISPSRATDGIDLAGSPCRIPYQRRQVADTAGSSASSSASTASGERPNSPASLTSRSSLFVAFRASIASRLSATHERMSPTSAEAPRASRGE
jgi:hypothetical protein